jgi:hypothetical protein
MHSQKINTLLSKSAVWEAYKGQKHDLFLPSFADQGKSLVGLLENPEHYLLTSAAVDQEDNEEPVSNDAIGNEFQHNNSHIQSSPKVESSLTEKDKEMEVGVCSKPVDGEPVLQNDGDSRNMQDSMTESRDSVLGNNPMDMHGDPAIDSLATEHSQRSELDVDTSLSPSKAIDDPLSQL